MNGARPIRVFVLIDALGWRFLKGRKFLSEELPVRMPLHTVLGFSSGAIPAILTGRLPAQNGHWNLFYYDPKGSPFRWLRALSFLPDHMVNNRVARKLMKEMGRKMLGMGPNFECSVSPRLLPWFNYLEKRDIYARGGILGAPSIFDELHRQNIPHRIYTYHDWSDREILERARRDLETSDASFFFVYLSELDMLFHEHSQEEKAMEERLAWYESRLQELFRLARKLDPNAALTVISDHGMTPVREHFDLVKQVDELGFTMPHDYLAVYDSTMARFWFFSAGVREEFLAMLQSLPCGQILSDEELDHLGILFSDRRYGETIFLLKPGWLLARSDFNGHGWMPVGMHGYHPDDPYSDAIFLSNRRPPLEMRTIADVHACLLEALDEVKAP
jgi:Type I phosphodiesterase / nucleotide pyrophosphatase